MKFLIFGAGGFLGSNLVNYLKSAGEEVYAVKRTPAEGAIAVNITKAEQFGKIKILPDVIINCASSLPDKKKDFNDPDYLRQLFETNVIGSLNIMNWAASRGIRKVINCSTLSVIERPWPVPLKETEQAYPQGFHVGYCSSKLTQELVMNSIANANKMDVVHLRISSLYGPGMKGDGILQDLVKKASNKSLINLTNGSKTTFDFIHVGDAVKVIVHLGKMGNWKNKVINLASGEEITLLKLAEILCELTGNTKEMIVNEDGKDRVSRAKVDTTVLEKYLEGTEITLKPFSEKIRSMF